MCSEEIIPSFHDQGWDFCFSLGLHTPRDPGGRPEAPGRLWPRSDRTCPSSPGYVFRQFYVFRNFDCNVVFDCNASSIKF